VDEDEMKFPRQPFPDGIQGFEKDCAAVTFEQSVEPGIYRQMNITRTNWKILTPFLS
jgi:hypothetical protein